MRLVDDRVGRERELGVADNGWNRLKSPRKVDRTTMSLTKVDRKVETSDEVVRLLITARREKCYSNSQKRIAREAPAL